MDFLRIEAWGILLNITGTCLWGIALLYFMQKRKKDNLDFLKEIKNERGRPFNEEIFIQMLKQQAGRSFRRISDAVMKEQQLLYAVIEGAELKKEENDSSVKDSVNLKKVRFLKKSEKGRQKTGAVDKYSEVLRLAELGMKTKKISEKLNIPKGEIELLIKLRKKQNRASESPVNIRAFS